MYLHGYDGTNYRFVDDTTKKIVVSSTAKFLEALKDSSVEVQTDSITTLEETDTNYSMEEKTDAKPVQHNSRNSEPIAVGPRRSGRLGTQPTCLFYHYADADEDTATGAAMMLACDNEPPSVDEALSSSSSKLWKDAMKKEMDSLHENQTWKLVPRSRHINTISPKWVFRSKPKTKNQEGIFKARLVCKGYQQRHRIDYNETLAPAVRIASLRTMLAVAIQTKMHICQMDVKTACLNGIFEEDIYMEQPEGFINPQNPEGVCKLMRAKTLLPRKLEYLAPTSNTPLSHCKLPLLSNYCQNVLSFIIIFMFMH